MKIDTYRITMLISTSIILALMAALIYIIMHRQQLQAVTTYRYSVITTNTKPLCPGDLVIYDQVANFTDTPAVLGIVASVWSVDEQRNVIYDTAPNYVNYPYPVTVNLHGEWKVPDTLKPGRYERRQSTTASGRKSQMFTVTFTVADGCKQ